jgi:hypothetical protein
LILKKIITESDWEHWRSDIVVDYVRDNHFTELKETEILNGRLATLNDMQQFVGDYFSKEWIMKNVLRFDDEQIQEMKDQVAEERASGELPPLDIPDPQGSQDAPPPEEKPEASNHTINLKVAK